jgi:proteasome lid subunit RPN8/RPN11
VQRTIELSRAQLKRFIRRAQKAWPYEVAAYLIGQKNTTSYKAYVFMYPHLGQGRKKSFPLDTQMIKQLKHKAQQQKMQVLGILHSHPRAEAVLSHDDYQRMASGQYGDIIGVLRVRRSPKNDHGFSFWTKVQRIPMPLKVIFR